MLCYEILQNWVFIGIMSLMNLKGHIYLVRMRVNKITQFHLRKFLMDRYNDEDEDNNNNKKVVDVTGNESTSGSKETAALDDGKASSNKDCSDKSTPDNSQDSMEIDGDSKTLMINQLMSC